MMVQGLDACHYSSLGAQKIPGYLHHIRAQCLDLFAVKKGVRVALAPDGGWKEDEWRSCCWEGNP